MTKDEELQALREENRTLKALVAQLLPLQEQLARRMRGSRTWKTAWRKTVARGVSRPLRMGWRVCHAVLVVPAASAQEGKRDMLGTRSRWWSHQIPWCVTAPRCAASAVRTSAPSQAVSPNAVKSWMCR